MRSHANNAYIDGANLHNSTKHIGLELDYRRLRIWLREKYGVGEAYIFLGFIEQYAELYAHLRRCGFILIFKEVVYDGTGKAKGNCDADLVLHAVSDAYERKFAKALIVSSDGDYASLVRFLNKRQQIEAILSPARQENCSVLLKRTNVPIVYLDDKRSTLEVG
jgi:uncharacterized LabA/DUF88 family protein